MTKPNKLFDMKSLLHNTFVLYFILFISVAYLFFFMQTGNFRSVFVFLLVGFLTSFYSKNMIVVLTCALIGTRIISTMDSLHEGLETKKGNANKNTKNVKKSKKNGEESSEEDEAIDEAIDEELEGVSNKEIKELLSDKKIRQDIQEDLQGMLKTQNEMIEGMSKLEPLIDKAEQFRQKYQKYEGMGQKFIETGK